MSATSDQAISSAVAEIFKLDTFLEITRDGLMVATKAQDMVHQHREVQRVLGRPDPFEADEKLAEAIAKAQKLEEFAREERGNGFSYVFELAVMRLWSILETTIDSCVVDVLKDLKAVSGNAEIRKIKLPIVEFLIAPEEERLDYLLNELKQQLKANLQPGVGRFEALLNSVGLGGEVNNEIRRQLFELYQVRNLIAHKGGWVDTRFKSACPWLSAPLGKKLLLDSLYFERYVMASHWYLLDLNNRYAIRNPSEEAAAKPLDVYLAECREVQDLCLTKLSFLVKWSEPPKS